MPFLEQVDGSTTKNIGFVSGTVIIVEMHLFIHLFRILFILTL